MQSYWMQMTDTDTVLDLRDARFPGRRWVNSWCACTLRAESR